MDLNPIYPRLSSGDIITDLLKMSKCELSLKCIADSQFFSNNSFTYFWKSFQMASFRPIANYSLTQNE